jgi:hypothetical protein
MAFSWPVSPVRLEGDRLLLEPRGRAGTSELPQIRGAWMRLAGLEPAPPAIADFASRYGLLRWGHDGSEALADWFEAIAVFVRMAAPWGHPMNPQCREMPAPGPAANLALREAHHEAQSFGHQAFGRDLYPAIVPDGAVLEPQTLVGFLFLDALASKRRRPAFRRCLWCGDWFSVGRTDQVYCTPRHRWQATNKKKEK